MGVSKLRDHGVGEGLDITEKEIRYAMDNSKSNAEAARFLRVSFNTYKKYASQYIDEDTKESLYDLHKNQAGKDIRKGYDFANGNYVPLWDVLKGKHPNYENKRLQKRIIKENILPEKCCRCGFCERRIVDYKIPLKLNYKDGDKTNHYIDNLELLCYNCYYLTVGNVVGRSIEWEELYN